MLTEFDCRQAALTVEPALEDLLADPVMLLLMERDQVLPSDLRRLLKVAKKHRLTT